MPVGKFITFEGPEGSGKSTHIRLLAEFLKSRGLEVTLTREPGGTPMGEAIRKLLQHNGSGESPVARTEVLLFLASRAQHVEKVIRPALAVGKWVLCDRFEDSTFAYQGYGRGFDLAALREANTFATGGLRPDLTILLDVLPETSRMRLKARQAATCVAPDRIECETDDFHARLRNGFLDLANLAADRVVVISSERETQVVAADVREAVFSRLVQACS